MKKKIRLQVSSVDFPHTGYGDEHVQQVYSELQKHTDRCSETDTHMLIGGNFNAQDAVDSNKSKDTHSESKIPEASGTDTGQFNTD